MINRIERQSEAFETALKYCRHYGLTKNNIVPKIEKRGIVGFYILDETQSTTVATVLL